MQIEVFSLCDAATSDVGKLNILGSFDTIWAVKTPLVYPQCAVALRMRFGAMERGEHQIAVNFVNADGKHVITPAKGKMKINFPDGQRSVSSNLILNLRSLKLEEYGEYSIDLTIDGKPKTSLPLFVKERKS